MAHVSFAFERTNTWGVTRAKSLDRRIRHATRNGYSVLDNSTAPVCAGFLISFTARNWSDSRRTAAMPPAFR
jgi:hypothetical protein